MATKKKNTTKKAVPKKKPAAKKQPAKKPTPEWDQPDGVDGDKLPPAGDEADAMQAEVLAEHEWAEAQAKGNADGKPIGDPVTVSANEDGMIVLVGGYTNREGMPDTQEGKIEPGIVLADYMERMADGVDDAAHVTSHLPTYRQMMVAAAQVVESDALVRPGPHDDMELMEARWEATQEQSPLFAEVLVGQYENEWKPQEEAGGGEDHIDYSATKTLLGIWNGSH